MGGFFPSKELKKIRERYPNFELSFDMIDEILEQCIVLTEEDEKKTGSFKLFLAKKHHER